jgi:hypothetical protein
MNQYAIFASSTHAFIQSDDMTGKLARAVRLANPSGIRLIRGWDEVLKFQKKIEKFKETPKPEPQLSPESASKISKEHDETETEENDSEVNHLVFVIHGIGQKLGERIDAVNFAEGKLIYCISCLYCRTSNSHFRLLRPSQNFERGIESCIQGRCRHRSYHSFRLL